MYNEGSIGENINYLWTSHYFQYEQDSWDIGQFYNANHLKYIVNSGQLPKNENIVEFQVGVEMFSKLKRQTNKPITSAL